MILKRSVLIKGKLYGPGKEDEVQKLLSKKDLMRLAAKGYVVQDVREAATVEESKPEEVAPKRKPAARKPKAVKG